MAWARGAAAGEWVAARVIVAEGDCVTGGVDGDADMDGFVVGGVDGAPDVDGCGEDPCIDCCVAGCEDDVLPVGGFLHIYGLVTILCLISSYPTFLLPT